MMPLPVESVYDCVYIPAWLCSCVGAQGSLLITSGFSLYLGNVFPVAMDYLRCAAGSVSDHHVITVTFICWGLFSSFSLYSLFRCHVNQVILRHPRLN